MRYVHANKAALVACALACASGPALGAEVPSEPRTTSEPGGAEAKDVLSLEQILELAEQSYPTLAQSRAKVHEASAQLEEAHVAPFSQFKFSGGVALAPTLRGSALFSPNTDLSLTSSLGLAWRGGVEGVVPLWTFGKIQNLWDAAKANVGVTQAQLEVERDSLRSEVRRAFFGLRAARDSLRLLQDARKGVDKALGALGEEVEEGRADPMDYERMAAFAAELEARQAEAEKFERVALTGLRFYSGRARLDIVDQPLRPPQHVLGHLSRYLEAARLYRPEVALARAGVTARTAQLQLARSQLFPDLGLGLSAGLSTAPEIADQLNPFVTDPGNYFRYGVGLALQWKLDFPVQAAKLHLAEAQLEGVLAQQRYALGGIASEVELAWAEANDWTKRVEAFKRAVRHAKRWYIMVQEGIDVGTQEEKDLVDPARQYATQRFNLLSATLELNQAISKLAKVTGWNAIAPDGS
jgi:outer membrane protein TolC